MRPAHFHYIVTKDGYDPLTTHIFDPDDPYIHSDAVFGVKASLMAKFDPIDDAARARELGFAEEMGSKFYDVEHDFVLAREGDVGGDTSQAATTMAEPGAAHAG